MKYHHRFVVLPAVLCLWSLLYAACVPVEEGRSERQNGETVTPEPTRVDEECPVCIPEFLKATLESIPTRSGERIHPLFPVLTAVVEGSPLAATVSPELTPFARVTPTSAPGYDLWVIEVASGPSPSTHQMVFPYPVDTWLQRGIDGDVIQNHKSVQGSILIHREISGCAVSNDLDLSLPWSSMEEEYFAAGECFESIQTYRAEDGQWVYQIVNLPSAEIQIAFSPTRQSECQKDSLAVISQYTVVDVSASTDS